MWGPRETVPGYSQFGQANIKIQQPVLNNNGAVTLEAADNVTCMHDNSQPSLCRRCEQGHQCKDICVESGGVLQKLLTNTQI